MLSPESDSKHRTDGPWSGRVWFKPGTAHWRRDTLRGLLHEDRSAVMWFVTIWAWLSVVWIQNGADLALRLANAHPAAAMWSLWGAATIVCVGAAVRRKAVSGPAAQVMGCPVRVRPDAKGMIAAAGGEPAVDGGGQR